MPDFKESTGYRMKGMDFGQGTGGSGMGGVHKVDIENKKIKAEIDSNPPEPKKTRKDKRIAKLGSKLTDDGSKKDNRRYNRYRKLTEGNKVKNKDIK